MTDRLVPAFFRRTSFAASLPVLLCMTVPGLAQDDVPQPLPSTTEEWRVEIWEAAKAGDRARFDEMLQTLPTDADQESSARLQDLIDARTQHVEQSDEDRDQGRTEAMDELRVKIDEGNISAALLAAVRLQTLSDDWNAVLDDDEIKQLIAEAEERGEQVNDWLLVQEVLFRLRTLHEDTGRHDAYEEYD
ncbi:MAG: hypothetical protein MK085_14130, partial [Phycisphaerales bacterium]|nr:hypothetical protein [Phycisphaerales bacterium]